MNNNIFTKPFLEVLAETEAQSNMQINSKQSKLNEITIKYKYYSINTSKV